MSKKGRVGGTIGFILALALVGGTIAYSTMFDPYAAAKTKKPVGEATGNVISAYSSQEGFEKTKQLVNDTMGTWFAPVQANAVYKSYTVDFNLSIDEGTKGIVTMDGCVYSDEKYTFLKVNSSTVTAGAVQAAYSELFCDKATNVLYARSLNYAQNPQDTSVIKDVAWDAVMETSPAVDVITYFSSFELIFGTIFQTADAWDFNMITGQFELKGSDENSHCSFTVGFNPRLLVTTSISQKGGTAKVNTSVSLHYSNLNNTVVNVPETLKNKVGA